MQNCDGFIISHDRYAAGAACVLIDSGVDG